MNWGKGLALALVSFAALMAWFIVKASQNPEHLVTEHYYEQELKFQGRIDDVARARAHSTVVMSIDQHAVQLSFPGEFKGLDVRGELLLQRPNDPDRDRTFTVKADAEGHYIARAPDLAPGRYNAQLTWRTDSATYFTEERILVP